MKLFVVFKNKCILLMYQILHALSYVLFDALPKSHIKFVCVAFYIKFFKFMF